MKETIKIVPHDACTGCGACVNKCPVNAIHMESDSEGFLYPVISDACIHCGLCSAACPQVNKVKKPWTNPQYYAMWADEETRMKSSSGGAFSVLARWVLEQGGAVCGAAYQDNYQTVSHQWAETIDTLAPLRGSKYVQSDTGLTFQQAKAFLEQDRYVLYTGTPCQIAGLRGYLGQEYPKLITVDIVCHGVPSPKVYQSYLKDVSKGRTLARSDFRDKQYWGWGTATSLTFTDGTTYRGHFQKDAYWKGFLKGMITRQCCTKCIYAETKRVSDFTIADFWGVKTIDPTLDDKKGTSLISVNTPKGEQLLEQLKDSCPLLERQETKAVTELARTRNGCLLHSTRPCKDRSRFFENFKELGFMDAYEKTLKSYDIGYVGWWDSNNYGSFLTSYALNRTLQAMGKRVLLLEHPGMSKDSRPSGMVLAEQFFEHSDIQGGNYSRFNDLCEAFVLGSDQMWNWGCIWAQNPDYYFLTFADNNHRKITYATSFGLDVEHYPERVRMKTAYWFNRMNAVSVREKSGVTLCRRDFDRDATQVMDPVFLCDMDSWEELIALSKRKEKEEYLFAYILDPTEDKLNAVRLTAKKRNLPYRIALDAVTEKSVMERLTAEDPNIFSKLSIEDWLYEISHASYVVTDSFHGFCFSMIFRKPMIAYLNCHRGKARFDTIGELSGLADRIIQSSEEIEQRELCEKPVNFDAVHARLAVEVERSRKWLTDALNLQIQNPSVKELQYWKILEHDTAIYNLKNVQVSDSAKQIEQLKAVIEQQNRRIQILEEARLSNRMKCLWRNITDCLKRLWRKKP